MAENNAIITFDVIHGGHKIERMSVRGRITNKRASVRRAYKISWDRQGRRIGLRSAFYLYRLVSYQIDGQELVTIAKAKE